MDIEDKASYLNRRAKQVQSSIVSFKSAPSTSCSSYIWTYRHTGCDVVSVVTTTVPINNGIMKDFKVHNKDMHRIKAPNNKRPGVPQDSPLDEGLVVDPEQVRKKLSAQLRSEKKSFMLRLQASRNIRTSLENKAATIIQAAFRGYNIRLKREELLSTCRLRLRIRLKIKSYLGSKSSLISSWGQHRQNYQIRRNTSALKIQCCFRRFVSFKCLHRRLRDVIIYERRIAVIRIQCMARKVASTSRVKKLMERRRAEQRFQACWKIQMAVRRFLARRRVRRRRFRLRCVAARMIQCWYKIRRAHKIFALIKAATTNWKRFAGARSIQCMVRKKVAKTRVGRIRRRRQFLRLFKAARRVQAMVRAFLARVRVRRVRHEKLEAMKLNMEKKEQQETQRRQQKVLDDAVKLLEAVDIFQQAKRGNVTDVDDIFHGRVSEDKHSATDTDELGDSLLTIAASIGSTELVRRCLQWGFNVNHRNTLGLNSLMLAVKHSHLSTVQYLLLSTTATTGIHARLATITAEDAGTLLVMACTGGASGSTSGSSSSGSGSGSGSGRVEMLMTLLSKDLNPNSVDPETGMAGIHAAAAAGNVDACKTLLKYKVDITVVDDMGQTPVHKAASTSLEILKLLMATYATDEARVAALVKLDLDSKDAYFLAAVGGQSDVLDYVDTVLMTAAAERVKADETGWSPNDIARAVKLAETGNLQCLEILCEAGFDLAWAEEETNITVAMGAARGGSVPVVNFLMGKSMDLSVADSKGRNALHYAAMCRSEAMVVTLLTHHHAAACKMTEALLTVPDCDGNNPLHIAAQVGVDLPIDLIAPTCIEAALKAVNHAGLTPVLLAASNLHDNVIKRFIQMGANPTGHDSAGHDCLWHVLHPSPSVLSRGRPPVCSEVVLRGAASAELCVYPGGASVSRSDDAVRVASDISLVILLLRNGCSLFSPTALSVATGEELLARLTNSAYSSAVLPPSSSVSEAPKRTDATPSGSRPLTAVSTVVASSPASRPSTAVPAPVVELGDIVVRERSVNLLRALPDLLPKNQLWRLLLSCLRFDDSSGCCFKAILEGGALEALHRGGPPSATVSAGTEDHAAIDEAAPESSPGKHAATGASGGTEVAVALILESERFHSFLLPAWAVMLGNVHAFEHLLVLGIKPNVIADGAGNTLLHLSARWGVPPMVSLLLADKRVRLEATNARGYTAAMEGAVASNMRTLRVLFRNKASARQALAGRYWAWVLAFARRQERTEINTQTGRIGDDDSRYFGTAPEPFSSVLLSDSLAK